MVHGRNGHKKSLTQYTLRQYKRTWESEVKKNREAVTVKIVNKDIEIELFGAWRTVRGKKIYIGDASGSYGSGNCSDASGGIVDIAFDKMTAKDFGSMEKEWGSMEFGEEFAKYAKGGDSRKGMVVRDSKGKVQGACLFTKSGDRVNLHYVETNPANRGKKKGLSGIGSNILARLCAEIPSGGSLMLTATTDSLPFYKKIGMETMGNVARFTHANGQTFSRKIGIMPKSSMSELRRNDVFDLEDALPRGLLAGKESKKKKLANEEIEVIISTTDVLAPPTPGTDGKSSNTKGISTSLPALSVPIILNRRF
jgi:L-amino acid N-acyltransferase YncA